jgi:hypothetical protein
VQANRPEYTVLSHFETVYRPGERALASQLFEALGLKVVDSGKYVLGFVGDTASGNLLENSITTSEVTPEHWAFEQVLDKELQRPEVAELSQTYLQALKTAPQNRPHFGIAYSSLESWSAAVDGFQRAVEAHPELKGRAQIASKFVPGSPGAQTDYLHHAFIHTDIIGTSCLSLGLIIEFQHYAENPTPA